MSTYFPRRLLEERKRLNKTQAEFAELGGIERKAQANYESGERSPDAEYISDICANGNVDVLYLFTGKRYADIDNPQNIREQALLNCFRSSTPQGQELMVKMCINLYEQFTLPNAPLKSDKVRAREQAMSNSSNGIQVGGSVSGTVAITSTTPKRKLRNVS